jgi:hypothetical protein
MSTSANGIGITRLGQIAIRAAYGKLKDSGVHLEDEPHLDR